MKYFLLILAMTTFAKINIFSKDIQYINADETDHDIEAKGDTLYIVTDLTSYSSGSIIVKFVADSDTGVTSKSFFYRIASTKNEDVEKSSFSNIETVNYAGTLGGTTFNAPYLIEDDDNYGILKITGLEDGDDITITITYKSTSYIVLVIVIIIACALVLGAIICYICKKCFRCCA